MNKFYCPRCGGQVVKLIAIVASTEYHRKVYKTSLEKAFESIDNMEEDELSYVTSEWDNTSTNCENLEEEVVEYLTDCCGNRLSHDFTSAIKKLRVKRAGLLLKETVNIVDDVVLNKDRGVLKDDA